MSVFVDTDWLGARLDRPGVRVVDARWYLPTSGRDARTDYLDRHIPGAVFFDIDAISDEASDLPHMLPTAERFAKEAGALGLAADDTIVVYDGAALFSAPRVWWMLRTFGARDVRVLRGGLAAWVDAGRPVESGPVDPAPTTFEATLDESAVASRSQVGEFLASGHALIVDVRSPGRFAGREAEPRPGLRAGHMPGAVNLPYGELLGPAGLKSRSDLETILRAHGITGDKPIVTSCGSGVTAAILSLALHEVGIDGARLYDGSWAEWGGRDDTAVVSDDQS